MPGRLRGWETLPPGGAVVRDASAAPRTGGWRTGKRPEVERSLCVDCLLCWLYCPDAAVRLENGTFESFDLDYCKGCELCAAVCPTGAIAMVADGD
jgi:2-oxoacid:acceptor oxidoreductase delta subunit (pyruvate/2-ketoisovalerate family)